MIKKVVQAVLNTFFAVLIIASLSIGVAFLFGTRPYIVLSGSMEPTIHTGSLVFVDTTYEFDDVEIGDVIAFQSGESALVTHRVIGSDNGILETKGDNNEVSDGFTTSEENFKGLTRFSIPQVGYFFAWIQTKKGIILSATVGASLLVLDFALGIEDKEDEKEDKRKKEKTEE